MATSLDTGQQLTGAELQALNGSGVGSVGRTEFHKELGAGRYSTVWLVEGTDKWGRKERMACKVRRYSDRPLVMLTLTDYNGLVQQLGSHPNLVHTIDIVDLPDLSIALDFAVRYEFTELCDGDLQRELENTRRTSDAKFIYKYGIPETGVIEWVRQIAGAIRFLHVEQRMAHLDVKPRNIMYVAAPDGLTRAYKLRDFESAESFPANRTDVQILGYKPYTASAEWAAPEALANRHYWATPCDVYSLGASIAHSLLGWVRYKQAVVPKQLLLELFRKVRAGKGTTYANPISPGMGQLVELMLEVDTKLRPTIQEVCDSPALTNPIGIRAPNPTVVDTYKLPILPTPPTTAPKKKPKPKIPQL